VTASLRLGILSDLHLGRTGQGHWHNRLLYDSAAAVAGAAVVALNGEPLDAVYVLGDLTDAGTEAQLAQARWILDGLSAPWFALPGNHDLPAVRSGAFQATFAGHLPPALDGDRSLAIAALAEDPARAGGSGAFALDGQQLATVRARLERLRPAVLLVFSHQPLAPEPEWARAHGGKDAGHFSVGPSFLERVAPTAGRLVAFCAHQHWHHVLDGPGWRQCTTAALIEYPMEVRLVALGRHCVGSRTLPVAPAVAALSLEAAPWVAGRPEDREWTTAW
jgi:hypothetical protein